MWGIRVALLIGLASTAGCGLWNEELTAPSQLPPLRPAANKAMLDVALVSVPADHAGAAALWRDVDEQHMDGALRQRLAQRGVRCGLMGRQLPSSLDQLIEESKRNAIALTGMVQGVTIQRYTFSPGTARQIAASGVVDEIVVPQDEDPSAPSDTYQQAQCMLDVRCDPSPGDRVKLAIVPEIQHGQPRRHVSGDQGMLRFDMRRDKHRFEDLMIETELAIGQTLVLGATEIPTGLGSTFFVDQQTNPPQIRLLLIRLVRAPQEPLFSSDAPTAAAPLADDWL